MDIFGTPLNRINNIEYTRRFIRIEDQKVLPCKSSRALNEYKSVIGNYAQSNNIRIRFFDPRRMPEIMQPYAPGAELGGCVGIEITHQRGPYDNIKYGLINLFENDNDKTPFIKKMYNKLAEMIESKGNPFAEQQKNTMLKLIREGKIQLLY